MAAQAEEVVATASDSAVNAAAKKVERRKRFEAVFPLIKQELLEYLDQCKMPADAREWYDKVSCCISVLYLCASFVERVPAHSPCTCT